MLPQVPNAVVILPIADANVVRVPPQQLIHQILLSLLPGPFASNRPLFEGTRGSSKFMVPGGCWSCESCKEPGPSLGKSYACTKSSPQSYTTVTPGPEHPHNDPHRLLGACAGRQMAPETSSKAGGGHTAAPLRRCAAPSGIESYRLTSLSTKPSHPDFRESHVANFVAWLAFKMTQ